MDPAGKVALVTGAARRLGRAIARGLAEAGASIAVHHRDSTVAAEEAIHEFRRLGVRAEAFQADLTDTAQITALFARIDEAFGRLDILVNSAARFEKKPVHEITVKDWNRTLDLNLRAPFFCSQNAARLMRSAGSGVIINIADVGSFQPWSGYAHHSISKAGLVMMTQVLARALAPDIRVNAVAPGPVLPPDDLTADDLQKLAGLTALKRLGAPDDVSKSVLFLVSSDYITGETIVVDGGKLLEG
jgi:NAD(P)-dependent dehydrogenase (short-subunit alcohol dehydrogenase family)